MPRLDEPVDAITIALRVGRAIESAGGAYFLPARALMKVDLFAIGPTPYDEIEFAGRRQMQLRTTAETLVIKSPEDTVLRKLLWYREGGGVSDRQWRDVVEVLRVSGEAMDPDYLATWSRQLGISDLLDRARRESGR